MIFWFLLLFSTLFASEEIPKNEYSIQCHLDINGVILGQESIGDRITPPAEYASIMLANGIYSIWIPGSRYKSYKLHIWEDLLPGSNSDPLLRQKRKDALKQFVTTLINQNHPLSQEVSNQYQKLVSILQDQPIFPGFPHLIRSLQELDIPVHFIFRTFGKDGELIQKYLGKTFPEIVLSIGNFDEKGRFHYQVDNCIQVIQDPETFRILLTQGHWLIQDNFERWQKGSEQGKFGKLFPVSSNPEDRIVSIFADDNLELVMDPTEKTIVCCYDTATNKNLSTYQASAHLIKINPIEAALDVTYLTNQIMKTIQQLIPLEIQKTAPSSPALSPMKN